MTITTEPTKLLESKLRIWTEAEVVPEEGDLNVWPLSVAVQEAKNAVEDGRWPKVRSGEREPILWPIRLGVARRDEHSCRKCHRAFTLGDKFEIDHIVPWSAGGSDVSTNLRFLCKPCNRDRSNLIDGTEARPVLPITWWCVECWGPDSYSRGWLGTGEIYDMNISHRVDDGLVRAYCAQCQHRSWTDVTL